MDYNDRVFWYRVNVAITIVGIIVIVFGYAFGWLGGTPPPVLQE